MHITIWPEADDDFFNLDMQGPVNIALLVQNNGDPVTIEVRGNSAYPWASAMPPGLTDIANVLTYLNIARGFEYRLRCTTGPLTASAAVCIQSI